MKNADIQEKQKQLLKEIDFLADKSTVHKSKSSNVISSKVNISE